MISLYAKGLTTGDIQVHLAEIYGTEVSRDTISRITDAVVEDMLAWQNRPLRRDLAGAGASYPDELVVQVARRSSAGMPSVAAPCRLVAHRNQRRKLPAPRPRLAPSGWSVSSCRHIGTEQDQAETREG